MFNVLFVENSKYIYGSCKLGVVYGIEDIRGVVRILVLRNLV